MTGKMRRLFGFLGHPDMALVSQADITRYVEDELMAKQPKFGKRVEAGGYRDHVIYVQALFGLAHDTGRLPTDPTTHLTYQKKTGSRGRFTDAERFAIYEAALRSDNPLFKWLNLWGIFHGLRPAEIVEADTRDLVFENGIPVFYVQTDYREGDEKTVKTEASKRGLPIHSAFRDGFVGYVQSLPPGPLFSGLKPYHGRRADDASNKLNKWLHKETGIPKGKSFYWHRHTVKSMLEAKHVPDRLNDYLLGHAGPQQVAKVYLHREFPEVLAAVEKIEVPVKP